MKPFFVCTQSNLEVSIACQLLQISSDIKTDLSFFAQKPIIFNPATMLPGAVPPPRKQENSEEATFDKPASVTTLESSSRVSMLTLKYHRI